MLVIPAEPYRGRRMIRLLRLTAPALALFVSCAAGWAAPATVALPPAVAGVDALAPIASALQQLLAQDNLAAIDGHPVDLPALRRFYQGRAFQPVWAAHEDRVTLLTTALAHSAEDALDLPAPPSPPARPNADAIARRDLLLSDAALRLATVLAIGRARPDLWEEDWAIPAPSFDPVAGLDAAITGEKLGEWLAGLAPRDPRYLRLKAALSHYRDLAAQGAWPTIPGGPTIKPGMADPRVPLIRQRLVAEGYLPADTAGEDLFDGLLMLGIAEFQLRHGITGDGAIGARTIAALNVPLRARIEQIALNLERWRSLPRDFGRNYAFVNVPAQTLEIVEDSTVVLRMRVVVGDPGRPTPVVLSRIQAVTLNPLWRVPLSIGQKEIAPKVKADRNYLAKNNMVAKGSAVFEQLPGPKNPLGRIKFETPNKFDVYLHDTPTRNTFERAARAVSHGCIRLEDARSLALYVLQDPKVPQNGWTPGAIQLAVDTGATQQIEPGRHLRVAILYFTSFADEDGTAEFRDDLYGRDKRLRSALSGSGVPDALPVAKAGAPIKGTVSADSRAPRTPL